MSVAWDRDALYYPYIHIRDVNWLKATLLCFPQVRRLVPDDFHLNDSPEVQAFLKVKGLRGEPLLREESTNTAAIDMAQMRLWKSLKPNVEFLITHYSQARTAEEYGKTGTFQIHRGKMHDLLMFLEGLGLAWHEWEIRGASAEEWFGVHPRLGEAIMSVIAIAVARDKGLDIVTNSGYIHHAVASLDESAVVNNVLETYMQPASLPPGESALELTDELAEVVLTTCFDVTRLNAEQIGELTREGHNLQLFKNELVKIASAIPEIMDPVERKERLKASAAEVIKNWQKYKTALPKYALDAMVTGLDKTQAPNLVASAVSGAASFVSLGAAAGLAIGLIVYSELNVWQAYKEKTNNPYQFLSQVEKAGAVLTLPPLAKKK